MNIPRANSKPTKDALSSGKKPRGPPRTRWRKYVKDLTWSHWNSTSKISGSCKKSRCLEITTRAAAPKRTSGQREILN